MAAGNSSCLSHQLNNGDLLFQDRTVKDSVTISIKGGCNPSQLAGGGQRFGTAQVAPIVHNMDLRESAIAFA